MISLAQSKNKFKSIYPSIHKPFFLQIMSAKHHTPKNHNTFLLISSQLYVISNKSNLEKLICLLFMFLFLYAKSKVLVKLLLFNRHLHCISMKNKTSKNKHVCWLWQMLLVVNLQCRYRKKKKNTADLQDFSSVNTLKWNYLIILVGA